MKKAILVVAAAVILAGMGSSNAPEVASMERILEARQAQAAFAESYRAARNKDPVRRYARSQNKYASEADVYLETTAGTMVGRFILLGSHGLDAEGLEDAIKKHLAARREYAELVVATSDFYREVDAYMATLILDSDEPSD